MDSPMRASTAVVASLRRCSAATPTTVAGVGMLRRGSAAPAFAAFAFDLRDYMATFVEPVHSHQHHNIPPGQSGCDFGLVALSDAFRDRADGDRVVRLNDIGKDLVCRALYGRGG